MTDSFLSENARAAIKRVAEERGISRLVHFTRVENLPSIFAKGLVPQSDTSIPRKLNNTVDGNKDFVCLSISHVSEMFFPMRDKDPPNKNWCVIVLNSALMWEKSCQFTPINAVSKILRGRNEAEFYGAQALEGMFAETVTNPKGEEENRPDGLQENMVTNPQAEVRVLGVVEARYVTEVHFHPDRAKEEILAEFDKTRLDGVKFRRNRWFFYKRESVIKERKDYLRWLNDQSF